MKKLLLIFLLLLLFPIVEAGLVNKINMFSVTCVNNSGDRDNNCGLVNLTIRNPRNEIYPFNDTLTKSASEIGSWFGNFTPNQSGLYSIYIALNNSNGITGAINLNYNVERENTLWQFAISFILMAIPLCFIYLAIKINERHNALKIFFFIGSMYMIIANLGYLMLISENTNITDIINTLYYVFNLGIMPLLLFYFLIKLLYEAIKKTKYSGVEQDELY